MSVLTKEEQVHLREAVEDNAVRYWGNPAIVRAIRDSLDTIADLQRQAQVREIELARLLDFIGQKKNYILAEFESGGQHLVKLALDARAALTKKQNA